MENHNKSLSNALILISIFFFGIIRTNAQRPTFSCNYYEIETQITSCIYFQNAYKFDLAAERAVEKILNPIGLPKNFILISCPNISNAVALTTEDGNRYIVYDKLFMEKVNSLTSDWSSIAILAHEIGHHLSGHTLSKSLSNYEQQQREIEADEFEGFILYKLGASLEQAQAPISLLADENFDINSTHPAKSKRLLAIKTGYKKAMSNTKTEYLANSQTPEIFFEEGNRLYDNSNFTGAIDKYTAAIGLNPNFAFAYVNRALAKLQLKNVDWDDIIIDCNKAIALKTDFGSPYFYRGRAEYAIAFSKILVGSASEKDFKDAIADFEIANKYDSSFIGMGSGAYQSAMERELKAEEYCQTGRAEAANGQILLAIEDFTKAINLSKKNPKYYDYRGLANWQLNKDQEAISDFTKSIETTSSIAVVYFHRGKVYANKDNYLKASADFKLAVSLDPNNIEYLMDCGYERRAINDLKGALNNFNTILSIETNNAPALLERAVTYRLLNRPKEALIDLEKAIALNPNEPTNYYQKAYTLSDMKDSVGACFCLKKSCELGLDEGCKDFKQSCK